jgi:hypothetical protein
MGASDLLRSHLSRVTLSCSFASCSLTGSDELRLGTHNLGDICSADICTLALNLRWREERMRNPVEKEASSLSRFFDLSLS